MDPIQLDFNWIKRACEVAKREPRNQSFSEFEDIQVEGDTFQILQKIVIEIVSEGRHCVLFINTCPVAQIDFRGETGLAEFFELPPMSEDDWHSWEMLAASTIHFEMKKQDDDLMLIQVKKEEGIVNALRIRREINMKTGDSEMEVMTVKCTLPAEPTFRNLMHWLDVRAGTCDPVVLKHV